MSRAENAAKASRLASAADAAKPGRATAAARPGRPASGVEAGRDGRTALAAAPPANTRRTVAGLGGVLLGGLCFAPVFGVGHLWLPVGLVCLVSAVVAEVCRRRVGLLGWRPLLVVVAGVLAIVESVLQATTLGGLPTLSSIRALGNGLTAWRLTLESTWPARPEPELLIFVPLLALVACVLTIELLDRAPPLVALLPAIGVVGVSQLYVAAEGLTAVLIAVGFGLLVIAVLISDHFEYRRVTPWAMTAVVTLAAVVCGFVVSTIDPRGRTPYSLQRVQSATAPASRQASPLDELAGRLSPSARDKVVFKYQTSEPVDRWRLVALDSFDGVNWTADHPLLRMGSQLAPGPEVRVDTTTRRALIRTDDALEGPWLPGQLSPETIGNAADPQVEPIGSTLVVPERPDYYNLAWAEPDIDADYLSTAGVDSTAPGGLNDMGPLPPEIADLNPLEGKRATMATAIALEKYFRTNYRLASANSSPPTGYSWPQLKQFLGKTKNVGSSEQFAAAYVALARQNSIPARLVVGFRAPAKPDAAGWYTVTNKDAYAWPEVAVAGVGWWPLDPAVGAQTGSSTTNPTGAAASITDQARKSVPDIKKIQDPETRPPSGDEADDANSGSFHLPLTQIFAASAALLLLWLAGVPLLKQLRAQRRRRRSGSAAVVGAWAEARDRIRAHGIPVTSGMTVRDLAHAARDLPDTGPGLASVALAVDHALWSGGPTTPNVAGQAWTGVHAVRRALRSRPWLDRFQAALELRTLIPGLRQK
ncbi:transglutaminaseTgpA domain-containing protein [Kribbella yunnanensis]|uniref:transglutaminase family protein n=1 Tax=Kribbella yunnanensis TaxID=190194 RepID=UPI0031DDD6D0